MEQKEFLSLLTKSIGAKVDIINKSGLHKGTFVSEICDVREDGSVGLASPMYKGAWLLMSGLELTIRMRMGESLFEATVFSRSTSTKNLPVPILWVVLTEEIKKIQRRSFLRVPCLIDADCCGLDASVNKNWFQIVLKNVSIGGTAAAVKEQSELRFLVRGYRYLISADLGKGAMFLNVMLRNILKDENDVLFGAFSFEGLSTSQERIVGSFVRRQELASKG